MQEVAIKIRFKTACLGAHRYKGGEAARFERSGDHVIFMPTWWREILEYGAKASNPSMAVELARSVTFSPTVDGQVKSFQRHYTNNGRRGWCTHEAFVSGQVIGVRAMLPDNMTLEDLERILQTAGPYKGISPYGKDALGFGRFDVLEVQPVCAQVYHPPREIEENGSSDTA